MSALPEFLLARYAEDEAVARRLRDHALAIYGRDPAARPLADVEAKRRIVEIAAARVLDEPVMARGKVHAGVTPWAYTLRLLALPYSDHPDYRQEWKPGAVAVPHPCLACGHALYRHAQDGRSCADCETCDGYREKWTP